MELRGYLAILWDRRRILLLVTLLGVLGAVGWTAVATPTYVARSGVLVSAGVGTSTGELSRSFTYAQGMTRSYTELATQPVVLTPVIDDLGLATTPEALADSITVEAPLDSVVLHVVVTRSSAREAADIANSVAEHLTDTTLTSDVPNRPLSLLVSVLERAEVPTAPTTPRKRLDLVVGAVVGLLLGVVAAVARDTLDPRVRDPREASALAGVRVLGTVPADLPAAGPSRLLHRIRSALRAGADRRSAQEAMHELRANVRALCRQRGLRTVALASAARDGAAGRTTWELAAALGRLGENVVVVDADPRHPTAALRSGVADDEGLTTVLRDGAPVRDVVVRSPVEPLWVLPAGPELLDSARILDEDAVREVLRELAERHDLVLIKAPPVLSAASGLMLCAASDGVLVVTDNVAMHRDRLVEELREFEVAGADVLGVVFTRTS